MDRENSGEMNKIKRVVSSKEDDNSMSKRLFKPSPTCFEGGSIADGLAEILSQIQPHLNRMVQEEVKNALKTHLYPLLESVRREKKEKEEVVIESGIIEKFKLVFCNEIASIIFTNNEIIGENGEPLRVAICDATTNIIICTGLLSSVQIEFFVLDGDYVSDQQDETHSMSDFNKSILSPRDGKRPLLVGSDKKVTLKNGVGLAKILSITDNSSWRKSKKFRMGARVRDEKILWKFPKIGVAMSPPFRVMDHRGEVNKKHHPPSREDEVWRLEGIGKDGAYHKNLSFHEIKNVGDFLEAYHRLGSTNLRKLLGIKVPKKTWMMMVENALECVTLPTNYEQNSKDNSLGNKFNMGADEAFIESPQAFEQNHLGFGYESPRLSFDEALGFYFEDHSKSVYLGEASTTFQAASQTITFNTIKDLGSN